jgi:dTDP-3-amino-3,4,6-trideoxy-alpha-D-glucose transaminase
MSISLFDTAAATAPLRSDFEAAFSRVLERGTYILGEEVAAFEQEFAAYLGVGHVIGVANGTDAITLALLALGVGAGDDVVVPSFTFYASAEAIVPTGARPVFCDVDPDTFCVTAETVKAALTPATKAIVAVDLFGNPIPIAELEPLGIPIVEDAAQAAGTTLSGRAAGSLGRLATFSFYPSKNLGCLGDGGAVATDDDELAAHLRMLRSHGSRDRAHYEIVGYNSRLDELQAAMLRISLPRLDSWAAARREVGRMYREHGLEQHATLPTPVHGADPAWHLFVIRHPQPDAVGEALTAAGIGSKVYYRTPIHRQPSMREFVNGRLELPVTDELALTHISIPIGSTLTSEQVAEIVSVIAGVSRS